MFWFSARYNLFPRNDKSLVTLDIKLLLGRLQELKTIIFFFNFLFWFHAKVMQHLFASSKFS